MAESVFEPGLDMEEYLAKRALEIPDLSERKLFKDVVEKMLIELYHYTQKETAALEADRPTMVPLTHSCTPSSPQTQRSASTRLKNCRRVCAPTRPTRFTPFSLRQTIRPYKSFLFPDTFITAPSLQSTASIGRSVPYSRILPIGNRLNIYIIFSPPITCPGLRCAPRTSTNSSRWI